MAEVKAESKSESKSESKYGDKSEEKKKAVIDWEEAMVQVGGDEDFLSEVLGDLLSESKTAEDEISKYVCCDFFAKSFSLCLFPNSLCFLIPFSAPHTERAIEEKNFSNIMNAAHRIKGSASYLCCEHLRHVSLLLQEKGHNGTLNPDDKLLEEIKKLYQEFCDCVTALQQEILKSAK